jgi:hypothetical protein
MPAVRATGATSAACAILALALLTAPPAAALSCDPEPRETGIDRMIRQMAKADAGATWRPVLAMGVLSRPQAVDCEGQDWTNGTTCKGDLRFTGTLITARGMTEVNGERVQASFYEAALDPDVGPPLDHWQPWRSAPTLMALTEDSAGALAFVHLDDCGQVFLSRLTRDLQSAVLACQRKGRCSAANRRALARALEAAEPR